MGSSAGTLGVLSGTGVPPVVPGTHQASLSLTPHSDGPGRKRGKKGKTSSGPSFVEPLPIVGRGSGWGRGKL